MPAPSLRRLFMRQILSNDVSLGGTKVTRRAESALHDAVVSTMHDPRRAPGAAHHLSALHEREKARRRHARKRLPKPFRPCCSSKRR